jgi:PhzF family phenazine biosynthesis protein
MKQRSMTIRLFQIDAFTSRAFAGNPAAVCPLENWFDDAVLQAIAAENNLSETAFFVPEGEGFALRWFTPLVEVDLCGHATLASGHVVLEILEPGRESVTFTSHSGPLTVARAGDALAMDLPAMPPKPCESPADLVAGLGARPEAVLADMDYLAVFASEAEVAALAPDMAALTRLDRRGVIATAPGESVDFVSRFFAPRAGIPEDPVTGSAHCLLTPYWAERLSKDRLEARQISMRGGALMCEMRGERVRLEGHAVLYLDGQITL